MGLIENEISYELGGNTLYVGSLMEYAAMQQYGGKKEEFSWLWGDILLDHFYVSQCTTLWHSIFQTPLFLHQKPIYPVHLSSL